MPRLLAAAALTLLFTIGSSCACEFHEWKPDDVVENQQAWSANGRYGAVVRLYPMVADFGKERAGKVFRVEDPIEDPEYPAEYPAEPRVIVPEPPSPVIAALYESNAGSRRLVSEFPIDWQGGGELLVSDSGAYVIVAHGLSQGWCGSRLKVDDPLLVVYRSDGSWAGTLTVGDAIDPNDLDHLTNTVHLDSTNTPTFDPPLRTALREEAGRAVIVLSFRAPSDGEDVRYEDRRVDVATATLLDPRGGIYPSPHVFVTPADPFLSRKLPYGSSSPGCFEPVQEAARVPSKRLVAAIAHGPMPPFPIVAGKAMIRATVWVELVVSESGDVLCSRATPVLFGLGEAAERAVRQWKFKPFTIDGRPAKMAGELVLHFEDVNRVRWEGLSRNLPPP